MHDSSFGARDFDGMYHNYLEPGFPVVQGGPAPGSAADYRPDITIDGQPGRPPEPEPLPDQQAAGDISEYPVSQPSPTERPGEEDVWSTALGDIAMSASPDSPSEPAISVGDSERLTEASDIPKGVQGEHHPVLTKQAAFEYLCGLGHSAWASTRAVDRVFSHRDLNVKGHEPLEPSAQLGYKVVNRRGEEEKVLSLPNIRNNLDRLGDIPGVGEGSVWVLRGLAKLAPEPNEAGDPAPEDATAAEELPPDLTAEQAVARLRSLGYSARDSTSAVHLIIRNKGLENIEGVEPLASQDCLVLDTVNDKGMYEPRISLPNIQKILGRLEEGDILGVGPRYAQALRDLVDPHAKAGEQGRPATSEEHPVLDQQELSAHLRELGFYSKALPGDLLSSVVRHEAIARRQGQDTPPPDRMAYSVRGENGKDRWVLSLSNLARNQHRLPEILGTNPTLLRAARQLLGLPAEEQ